MAVNSFESDAYLIVLLLRQLRSHQCSTSVAGILRRHNHGANAPVHQKVASVTLELRRHIQTCTQMCQPIHWVDFIVRHANLSTFSALTFLCASLLSGSICMCLLHIISIFFRAVK
jgi:hypothetical protein